MTLSLALLEFFLSSDARIYSAITLLPFRNSSHMVVSVAIDSLSNSKWEVLLHRMAYGYSCPDWGSLHDHLRDVPWKDIFKLSASTAACKYL